MLILSFLRKKVGFTLVELLVVITILALLALVGFVVFSQQSSQARDTSRIATIRNLHDGARMVTASLQELPLPSSPVALSISGAQIGWQGYVSSELTSRINYSDSITDPSDGEYFTYRLSQWRDRSQFLVHLENSSTSREMNLTNVLIPQIDYVYASVTNLSDRFPYVWWEKLGIFLEKGNNLPIQNALVSWGGSGASIDLSSSGSSSYKAFVHEQIQVCSLTWAILDALEIPDGIDDRIANTSLVEWYDANCWSTWNGWSSSLIASSPVAIPWNGQMNVTWSMSTGATSYILAWSTSSTGVYTEIPGLTWTWYIHTGLSNGSTYYYKMRSVKNSEMSPWSSSTNATLALINYAGQVAIWPYHACAVKSDGALACWYSGNAPVSVQSIPSEAINVVKVVVLTGDTCVLRADRKVFCWWANSLGWSFVPKIAQNNIVDIAWFNSGICAQRYDNLLVCWWLDGYYITYTRPAAPINNYRSLAVGYETACFITHTWTVDCVGWNAWSPSYTAPLLTLPGLADVDQLSVSDRSACALDSNGDLTCWWINSNGETNVPPWLSNISFVVRGGTSTCAQTSIGWVSCWWANNYGTSYFDPINAHTWVVAVSNFDANVCIIHENGGLFCQWSPWFENNIPAALQHGIATGNSSYVMDDILRQEAQISATMVQVSSNHACAIKPDMTVACWRDGNDVWQADVPNGLTGVIDIALGSSASCALQSTWWVTCWGHPYVISGYTNPVFANRSFQSISAKHMSFGWILQDDTPVSSYAFASTGASMMAVWSYHACIIRKVDGSIECSGGFVSPSVITPPSITWALDISAWESHTCALESGGTVVCWWANNYGQINVPVWLSQVVAIRTWDATSCALKSDGTFVCWWRIVDLLYGINAYPPIWLQNVADFSMASTWNFCAVQSNGTLVCSQYGWFSTWITSGIPSN